MSLRPMSLGNVCMPLSNDPLMRSRRRVAPRRAVTFFLVAQKESNQRKSALNTSSSFPAVAMQAGAHLQGLTRYGLKFRLHRGAPRLGHDTGPGGSVQTQALPNQSDLSARPGNALRDQTRRFVLGSFSLVTFSLSQQRESDCQPGHSRRRLGTPGNSA